MGETPEPPNQIIGRKRQREDETESQRLKREKAAERQRRKRERDRAQAQAQAAVDHADAEARFAAEQARMQVERQEADERAAATAAHAAAQAAVALLFPPPPPQLAEELTQHFVMLHQTHPHLVPAPISNAVPSVEHFPSQPRQPDSSQQPIQQFIQEAPQPATHETTTSAEPQGHRSPTLPRQPTPPRRSGVAPSIRKDSDTTQMTPEEIARRDKMRADARERQRKHRAAVKARKNQQLGIEPALEESTFQSADFVHEHPDPPTPPEPVHALGGQTFASTLLLSFSCAPLLKAHLLRTLNMTNEELASFEPIIADAWDRWNAQRQNARVEGNYGGYYNEGNETQTLPPHMMAGLHQMSPQSPPHPLPEEFSHHQERRRGRERDTQETLSPDHQSPVLPSPPSRPKHSTRRPRQQLEHQSPHKAQSLPQRHPQSPSQGHPRIPPVPTLGGSEGQDMPPTVPVVDPFAFRNRISALTSGLGLTRSFSQSESTFRSPYDHATMSGLMVEPADRKGETP